VDVGLRRVIHAILQEAQIGGENDETSEVVMIDLNLKFGRKRA